MKSKNFLVSCVGAYGDSGIGTGGFVLIKNGISHIIDKLDSTGLFKFKDSYFRFIRAKKLLVGYNNQGVFYKCKFPKVSDCHDIYLKKDEVIFIATSLNEIQYYDYLGNLLSIKKMDGEGDAWHLNCLEVFNDQSYITAFGKYNSHRQWNIEGCFEKGFLYNLDTDQIIISGLSGPHTPRQINNKWFICNSHTNSLRIYENGKEYYDVQLGGFTRGMTSDSEYIYVGVSADRKSSNPTSSKIIIINILNYKIVDSIDIPFPEIYDIIICDDKIADNFIINNEKFQLVDNNETYKNLTDQIEQGYLENLKLHNKLGKLQSVKVENFFIKLLKKIKKKLF